MSTYIFNGKTYDSANLLGFGYAEEILANTGDPAPRYVAPMIDALADAANSGQTSSLSSVTIGLGTKVFVLTTDIPVYAGTRGHAIDKASPNSNFMFFNVVSYVSATKTLTVDVTITGGAGTISDWDIITRIGARGPSGAATLQGPMTGDIETAGFSIISTGTDDINLAPATDRNLLLSGSGLIPQAVLASQVFN